MADRTPKERLFPSLLDRLTDDHPEQQRESRDQRVFSVEKLRAAVLRDLAWLLNTCHFAASQDLSDYPNVEDSVINFGIPDLTGKTVSGLELFDVQRTLRQCILNFEPRILPGTLEVRGEKLESAGNTVVFEIEGELWSLPIPERLFLRTELDLENGDFTLSGM